MSKNPKPCEILSLLCIGGVSTCHRCLTVHLPLFVYHGSQSVGYRATGKSKGFKRGPFLGLCSPSGDPCCPVPVPGHGDNWERLWLPRLSPAQPGPCHSAPRGAAGISCLSMAPSIFSLLGSLKTSKAP